MVDLLVVFEVPDCFHGGRRVVPYHKGVKVRVFGNSKPEIFDYVAHYVVRCGVRVVGAGSSKVSSKVAEELAPAREVRPGRGATTRTDPAPLELAAGCQPAPQGRVCRRALHAVAVAAWDGGCHGVGCSALHCTGGYTP